MRRGAPGASGASGAGASRTGDGPLVVGGTSDAGSASGVGGASNVGGEMGVDMASDVSGASGAGTPECAGGALDGVVCGWQSCIGTGITGMPWECALERSAVLGAGSSCAVCKGLPSWRLQLSSAASTRLETITRRPSYHSIACPKARRNGSCNGTP